MTAPLLLIWLASAAFAEAPAAGRSLGQASAIAERSAGQKDAASAAALNSAVFDGSSAANKTGPSRARGAVRAGAAGKSRAAAVSPAKTAVSQKRPAAPSSDFTSGFLGLYPESDFELSTGRCASERAPAAGRRYFMDDIIAAPKADGSAARYPQIVWIGSKDTLHGMTMSPDGKRLIAPDGSTVALELVKKIDSNLSYYNESSTAYFQGKKLRVRGTLVNEGGGKKMIARTIWPEDFRVDLQNLLTETVSKEEDLKHIIKREKGAARTGFFARLLWEKSPGARRSWGGKPVMGIMLNGAQGDDDEARAGHFSFFDGRMGPGGEMADWVFSNFYDLAEYSEKGIIPALVPMDKYMADLNSGQSWYRGTHVLAAVMKDDAVAMRLQHEYEDLYRKYYTHEVKYDRTYLPCASLIIDGLRRDGWNVPKRGPSHPATARPLVALLSAFDAERGRAVGEWTKQERTRLFPRAAFEGMAWDLLSLVNGEAPRELTPFERELKDSVEGILLIRVPQLPSSRAFGTFSVASAEEYWWEAPKLPGNWVGPPPNPPRPIPPMPGPGACPQVGPGF